MRTEDSRPRIEPVTRAELEAVYGPDGLRRIPAEELPASITDPGARAFLSEIGLIDAPNSIVVPEPFPLRALSEALAPHSPAEYWPTLPNNGADLVEIGRFISSVFALDGATGEVYALGAHQPPTVDGRPAHRSLHSLARCQLAFGAREMLSVVALLEQEDIDWCREHLEGFTELYPTYLDEEPDEDGNFPGAPADDEPSRPSDDEIFAGLADKLNAVEPGLLDHPVWADILDEFRYGY
ncbi:SUKH-4 family immunity protein [Kitasatospora sp. NPDC057198]|uniref:SUKH-4 family immunity protein n=1 Tax=Kitasatospora sp. NPDC057198 TaxID=3346046 RepID=UPI0036400881